MTPFLALALLAQIARADTGLAHGIATADSLIGAAVEHTIPGAVLVVAQNGRLVHERAFGWAELKDFDGHRLSNPRPMQTSTLFDLASVTKVMATTMAVMMLVSEGRIDVDAPVYRYLPDFRGAHLDSITVRHLLQHAAGLVQWQPLYYHASNTREAYDVIRQMPLQWGVGDGRHYSDLGFMLLGDIVEHVSGRPLDRYVAESLYGPLGLQSTTFVPKQHGFADFAATEQGNGYERHMVYDSTFGYRYRGDPTAWNGWRQYVLNGETDDGNSWYANGGIAGHAGLFSTAADLRVLIDLLLAHGKAGGRQYIRPDVIDRFLTRDRYQNFLGWMSPNSFPDGSFSHTGFTGTYVLGVPKYGLSIVLLTNRQNMGADARGYFPDVGPLDTAVAHAIVAAAEAEARAVAPQGSYGVVTPGARVRVLAPAAGVPWPAEGVVDSLSADTVFFRHLSEPPALRRMSRVAVPLASISGLEVPIIGTPSRIDRALKGGLWGVGVYAVFAGAVIVHESLTCKGPDCFGEGMAWIGLVGGIPLAAGVGATVGFALPIAHWYPVPIPVRRP
jgi:CubicO group peptidase (beta-lactamase class C family)